MPVSRRTLLGSLLTIGGYSSASAFDSANRAIDAPANWLGPTRLINSRHCKVRSVASTIAPSSAAPKDRAIAIFHYVRDQIEFGFAGGFWKQTASDVLTVGKGFCQTKSTLMVALLRAAGVPARQVFVDIKADVLSGILDPGTPYVDHSYVEVFIEGRWLKNDAYIVDAPMYHNAKQRLLDSGQMLGFGVHATGTHEWNGETDAFSQFNVLDDYPISRRRWGVYDDVQAFYDQAPNTWNELNPLLRATMGALASGANRRAQKLRRQNKVT